MVVAIKSAYNNKYLRFVNDEIQTYGHIRVDGKEVMDSYAQFEIVKSDFYYGLFHIKCRYNNKYLNRWSPNHYWLNASADKPNEDKSNWNCTLFKRIDIKDDSETKTFRLLHVELDHYASLIGVGEPFNDCLFASTSEVDQNKRDVFTYVNLNLLFTVPQHVAFKSDHGKYLGAYERHGLPYLRFMYDSPTDPKVAHEMFQTDDGIVYVKSNYFEKFWRHGDGGWILADADDPRGSNYAGAMFRLTPLGINHIALLNMAPTWYLKRYSHEKFESCLGAATSHVDSFARLEVIDMEMVNN